MCFSATASFITAAITGGAGLLAMRRTTSPQQLPLAATPIVFAIQQVIEGSLWLVLPSEGIGPVASSLTLLFLLLAQVWWPIFVPVAVLLIEPHSIRRRIMTLSLIMGVGVAAYLLWRVVHREHVTAIVDGHMVYVTEYQSPLIIGLTYLVATALPPMLSSHRVVATVGAVVLVGAAVTYLLYWDAFVSVWCFFAAALSGLILFHFERQRWRSAAAIAG